MKIIISKRTSYTMYINGCSGYNEFTNLEDLSKAITNLLNTKDKLEIEFNDLNKKNNER